MGIILYKISEILQSVLLSNYKYAKLILTHAPSVLIDKLSHKKAMYVFHSAAKRIPAYKDFLKKNAINPKKINSIKDFASVPYIDKKNFVKKYDYEQRCLDGTLPFAGNIEESSGSTSKPTDWIKSIDEDKLISKTVDFEAEHLYKIKDKKYIIISCWSLGPWTTDLKFCEYFEHLGLLKNCGPDQKKVVELIKKFGKTHNYLISGYPPFLRQLFLKTKIKWKDYDVDLLVGGESYSLDWRDQIKDILGKDTAVYSSYGSSDVNIATAAENSFTVFLRQFLSDNKRLSGVI